MQRLSPEELTNYWTTNYNDSRLKNLLTTGQAKPSVWSERDSGFSCFSVFTFLLNLTVESFFSFFHKLLSDFSPFFTSYLATYLLFHKLLSNFSPFSRDILPAGDGGNVLQEV